MTTRGQTARRPGVAAPRRRRRWADRLLQVSVANNTTTTNDLTTEFADNDRAGLTVVRLIMCYSIRANNPGAVSGTQILDIAIGLFEKEAFGATVLPDVQTEADYPRGGWLYRCRHVVQDEPTADGVITAPEIFKDVRSQRKIGGPDAVLGLIAHNQSHEGNTFTVKLVGIIRGLYLLP